MSGHVFHPGHEELHGITVVITGVSGKTYIGRYHEQTDRGLLMHDVAVHDPATSPDSLDAWLARTRKYGVRAEHRVLVLPPAEVTGEIQRLG